MPFLTLLAQSICLPHYFSPHKLRSAKIWFRHVVGYKGGGGLV
jgi:hypothetical protein